MITIREQTDEDRDQVWSIIRAEITAGDTYYFARDAPRERLLDYWFDERKKGFVAVLDDADALAAPAVAGIFFLTPNFPDRASHIANAAYMVAPAFRGKGIGRKMAEFSLAEARRLGYRAMQFNFVVKTNEAAIGLWLDLGFRIIGEIPNALRSGDGFVNACILYREL